ncbi:hypothetical protein [Amycolatopsis sp. CFH S0078]|uniref:hypothetical protein n=1 Tax=Amycolatopsis sp. CFH S0078 TaxID=1644108 RepID=UPI00106E7E56|nr:hypothetical protein [Amycolatopsis sp. CFH S0078]
MTDPRELLDTYAHGSDQCDGECTHDCNDTRERIAPEAIVALRAVLDLHKPEDTDPDVDPGKTYCCTGCLDAYGDYRDYPCATVRAITTALGGSE